MISVGSSSSWNMALRTTLNTPRTFGIGKLMKSAASDPPTTVRIAGRSRNIPRLPLLRMAARISPAPPTKPPIVARSTVLPPRTLSRTRHPPVPGGVRTGPGRLSGVRICRYGNGIRPAHLRAVGDRPADDLVHGLRHHDLSTGSEAD